MNSRTPSALLQPDDQAPPEATARVPAIPELERSPFPATMEPDRSGIVVSTPRVNRKIVKRRVSPSTVLLILFVSAVAIVLYIGNVIAVGNLLAETNRLEKRHTQILMEQERLRFEIRQLSSLERIRSRAESELGLRVVREAPTWITVDKEKIRELEEAAAARTP
jgi:cell division protein FtsL